MKKKILIALALVAVVALSIGGTVAFLTARETDTNTFTMGDVSIDLTSELENENEPILLMPNNNDKVAANYRITNTGDSAAYVWLTVKIPVALEDTGDAAANNIIHWNLPGAFWYPNNKTAKYVENALNAGYITEADLVDGVVPDSKTWLVNDSFGDNKGLYTNENGVDYNVYNILYNGPLASGETTNVGVSTFFLDERIDKVEGGYALIINGEPAQTIDFDFAKNEAFIVEAHAIQTSGFDTVQEAFAAYQKQWNK
ncbi:MAG: hypothetical protein IJN90_02120 [Bacilli bacterium]|nr:hypothetical protein [Bacilli bacterium]